MRKLLAKGLIIVIEASLFVLAELIVKKSKRNGDFRGPYRGYFGRPDALRRAGHSLHSWRGMRRGHTYGRFIS